jgi:hypothetical protein
VVDALVLIHLEEDLLLDMVVSPAEIEVHVGEGLGDLNPLKPADH